MTVRLAPARDEGVLDQLRLIACDTRVAATLFRDRSSVDFFAPPPGARSAAQPRHFAAHDATTGHVVGGASFVMDELCYFVAPDQWRRGYGKEIARAALREAPLLGLDCVRLNIQRSNAASIRVAEGAGFVFAGIWYRPPGCDAFLRYVRRLLANSNAAMPMSASIQVGGSGTAGVTPKADTVARAER